MAQMKKSTKILLWAGAVLLLLVGLAYAGLKTGIFTESAKAYIIGEIKKATGQNVKIGRIELGLVNNVALKDVSVQVAGADGSQTDLVRFKALIFRVNFADLLFRKRSFEKSLTNVIIDSPVIHIRKKDNRFNVQDFSDSLSVTGTASSAPAASPAAAALAMSKITIQRGTLFYEDADRNFKTGIEEISGKATMKSNTAKLFLTGKSRGGQPKDFKSEVAYAASDGSVRATLIVDKWDMKHWLDYLLPQDAPVHAQSGRMSLKISAAGREFTPQKMDIKGTGSFEDAAISINGKDALTRTYAVFTFENGNIALTSAKFGLYGGSGTASGTVSGLYGVPSYAAEVTLEGADPSVATAAALSGAVGARLKISGEGEKIKGSGTATLDRALFNGIKIDGATAQVDLDARKLTLTNLNATAGGGRVTGGGVLDWAKAGTGISGSVTLAGVDASPAIKEKKGAAVLDSDLKISGTLKNPVIKGSVASQKLALREITLSKVAGTVGFQDGKTALKLALAAGKYEALELKAALTASGDVIQVSRFSLADGSEEILSASGSFSSGEAGLDITAALKGITLSKLQLNALKDRDVDGTFSGSARVTGKVSEPQVTVSLTSQDTAVRGIKMFFRSKATLSGDKLKIEEFNLNDNAGGTAEIALKKLLFTADMKINGLNGDILHELLGLKFLSGGTVNGAINIKRGKDGYGGAIKISAAYKKGEYTGFEADVSGAANNFAINKINIKQKKGSLKTSGTVSIKDDNEITVNINGQAKDYLVNDKLRIKGDFTETARLKSAEGQDVFSNRFKATELYFNGRKMDDISFNLRSENGAVPLFRFDWGETYWAEGKLSNPDAPVIDAEVNLKDADLYALYTLLNMRDKPLPEESRLTGRLRATGDVNRALFSGSLSQKTGSAVLDGEMAFKRKNGLYTPSAFNINYNASNMDLAAMGKVFAEGFAQTGRLSVKGTLKGTPAAPESKGEGMLAAGKIAGIAYENVTVSYAVKDSAVTLDKALLMYKNSYINLSGSKFEVTASNDYRIALKSLMKDFVIEGYKLNGELSFFGRATNFKGVVVDGSLTGNGFILRNMKFAPFIVKTDYADNILKLKLTSGPGDFSGTMKIDKSGLEVPELAAYNDSKEKILALAGHIGGNSADTAFTVDVSNADPQMINDFLGWDHKWKGLITGNVKVSSRPAKPPAVTVYAKIYNGTVDGVEFDLFSGLFTVKDDWLDLSPQGPLILSKAEKYEVKVTGKVPVPQSVEGEERQKGVPMDITATIKKGDLSIIKFLSWIQDASGPLDAELKIAGTKEFPTVSGKINVSDANVKIKYILGDIKHLFMNLLIKENIIDIYTFRGESGTGTLKIENLTPNNGGTMKFIKPYEANWKVTNIGDTIRFTNTDFMDFADGAADVDLEVTGPIESPFIKGTIKSDEMKITFPVKMKNQQGEEVGVKDNYAKKITWDLSVLGGNNVTYFNNYLNNYVDLKLNFNNTPLKFQGRGNDMKIYGTLGVKSGIYKYMNAEFAVDTMKQSKITFDGEQKPLVDVYAKSTLRRIELSKGGASQDVEPGAGNTGMQISGTYDLAINLRTWGRVGNLDMELTSDPSLGRNRLLYILTFGRDIDPKNGLNQSDAKILADAFASMLIRQGTQTIQKLIPIVDSITGKINVSELINPNEKATPEAVGNTPEAKVLGQLSFGKYITEKIYASVDIIVLEGTAFGDISTSTFIQQAYGLEYALDPTKAIKFTYTPGLENIGIQPEAMIGIESRIEFDSWWGKGSK